MKVVHMENEIKTDDASGRGVVEGYKIAFPAMLFKYNQEEIDVVVDVMRNTNAMTQGKYMRQFEEDFCTYTGAKHSFAVDNATNALRLASILAGLEQGNEVIIPAYTFCATAIPFGETGAKIVWADIDPESRLVSAKTIEEKVTKNTKVFVVVHLLGMPVDMDPVMELAKKYKCLVVEDCAQAPGAEYKSRKVGTIGDFGCFSFHGAKNITTLGEGGMLTVKSYEYAKIVSGLRHNGCRAYNEERKRYWVPAMSDVDIDIDGVWPSNFCIGEAQCALGSKLLKRLDKINAKLIKNATRIRRGLSDVPEITFPEIKKGLKPVYHVLVGKFNGSKLEKTRDDFMDIMVNKFRIRMIAWLRRDDPADPPWAPGFGEANCPNLEAYWDSSFSYPQSSDFTDEDIDYMIDSTKKAIALLKL